MTTPSHRVRAARRLVLSALAAAPLALTACSNAGEGAFSGAAIGALGGLAIGSLSGDAGKGATIGAVSGAIAGGVIGDQNERNARAPHHAHRAPPRACCD